MRTRIMAAAVLLLALGSYGLAQDEITDKELEELGAGFQTAFIAKDVRWVQGHFDLKTFSDRTWEGLELDPKWREAVGEAMPHFWKTVLDAIAAPDAFRFRRMYRKDGVPHLLFRALMQTGINYYDMPIRRMPGGGLVAYDMYVYLSGEYTSVTMRRALLPIVEQENQGALEKLFGGESDEYKYFQETNKVGELVRKGDAKGAVAQYRKLPESLQKQKNLLIILLGMSAQLDEKVYIELMDRFRTHYPTDPALNFIEVDWYFLREEYDKALECLEAVSKSVGPDGQLEVMKGGVYLQQKDLESARKAFEKAVEVEPDHEQAWWALIEVAMQQEAYERVAELLTAVEKQLELQIGDLETVDYYSEFVKSEAYRKWKAAREAGE